MPQLEKLYVLGNYKLELTQTLPVGNSSPLVYLFEKGAFQASEA